MDIKPKITVDKYEIIDSGTIVVDNNNCIEFEFNFEKIDLKFVFRFVQDSAIEGQSFKIEVKNESKPPFLEFSLINFDNSHDTGNVNLTPVATVDGRILSIKYRVSSIGTEKFDKIFNYSWYLSKKEVSDGQ